MLFNHLFLFFLIILKSIENFQCQPPKIIITKCNLLPKISIEVYDQWIICSKILKVEVVKIFLNTSSKRLKLLDWTK